MLRQTKGYIQIYSRKARDQIIKAGQKFLEEAGLGMLSSELFACVDELIKNAVKANYKFLLIRERIFEQYRQTWPDKSDAEIDTDINDIVKFPESFNHLAEDILARENLSETVRAILNEESRLLTIKNRAYAEKRGYTEDEKTVIRGLTHIAAIRQKIKDKDIRVLLRIMTDDHYIYIDITNTAPILSRDLQRIHDKRDEHLRCKQEGREHEFFINNIDTSESGFGLGYAKIDVILNNWGLENEQAVTIISAINTTVMLTLPLELLRGRAG